MRLDIPAYDDYATLPRVVPGLTHFFNKVYAGTTNTGGVIAVPATNLVSVAVFGDSVGGAKPQFIIPEMTKALGTAGRLFNSTPVVTGGASVHSDVSSGTYWINGQWSVLPSGGTVEFLDGGGRPRCTKLKIYYVKESGAGNFKVQVNNGAGYVDEASYTNVAAANATTTAGVITLTKTLGSYSIKLTGLSGTVNIIGAAWIDETDGGVIAWRLDQGGLALATANTTPAAIVTTVLQDMAIDLAFMEFKDTLSEWQTSFPAWMDYYRASVATTTDWVLIGTSPESDAAETANKVVCNALMKAYAQSHGLVYFDSMSPLTYAQLVTLGWNGDGTHLGLGANSFYAALLWDQLGLATLPARPSGRDFNADNGLIRTALSFGSVDQPAGTIDGVNEQDINLNVRRAINHRSLDGATYYQQFGIGYCELGAIVSLGDANTGAGPCIRRASAANGSAMYASDRSNASARVSWIAGNFGSSITSQSGTTYTVAATDSSVILTSASTVTLTLPTASTSTNLIIRVKGTGGGAVISASSNVVPLAGGSAGTAILSASAGKWAELQSDGTSWIIMAAN